MRVLLSSVCAFTLAAAAASAAPAPTAVQPPKTFMSAAEVAALAAAASQRTQGNPLVSQPIVGLAPYVANLEYRTAVGPAAVHETEAELFHVLDGSGTLVTGGKLIGDTRTNAANRRGTGVEGGQVRNVARGDFFIVPEGVPHWFSRINGTLVLMSLHVPHQSGNPR